MEDLPELSEGADVSTGERGGVRRVRLRFAHNDWVREAVTGSRGTLGMGSCALPAPLFWRLAGGFSESGSLLADPLVSDLRPRRLKTDAPRRF